MISGSKWSSQLSRRDRATSLEGVSAQIDIEGGIGIEVVSTTHGLVNGTYCRNISLSGLS